MEISIKFSNIATLKVICDFIELLLNINYVLILLLIDNL